ncbi:MAG: hypothetical protein HN560_15310 [Anaerolineae bacterium]|nr:hypothetical protein [Anaerolineae bacterium]MBT7192194.1 hypothetical protein [Anaerolineae bacterium]MBT7602424.1 hypothetical protein [Anaerolineae bacterium]
MGRLSAENALTGEIKAYDADYIPRVTFTDPQIASADLTEVQATKNGYSVKVSTLPTQYSEPSRLGSGQSYIQDSCVEK